ncbi:MAG: DNA repair protein RadA [Balneolaceae bacterium]|nr:MAG: DNA repair protein RadA [Balneolaceae bacterium]
MAKKTSNFVCENCGHISPKWLGSCPSCSEWNSFSEREVVKEKQNRHKTDISDTLQADPVLLSEITFSESERLSTQLREFDRVLGGGLIKGSFLLLGGDPGIGKSTLMLQIARQNPGMKLFYVAGEESATQIKQRASRIGLEGEHLYIGQNTEISALIRQARTLKPDLMVIDSIQTLFSKDLNSLPGSIQQIRECSVMLQQIAKKEGITTLMVGHVTKEGDIAGPRILEHMVDTVLQFEGDKNHYYRLLRCIKNRFGPAQEVGVFEMKANGLEQVLNPSALFLTDVTGEVSGNAITCIMEGSRPILAEVQALVTPSNFGTPQRTASGFDQRRLSLLIAVLEKRTGLPFSGQDVYLNIAGGLKISDPAADLAVVMALWSSLRDKPVNGNSLYIGEVGLSGEIRKVPLMERRISEAEKMGFKEVYSPKPDTAIPGKIELKTNRFIRDLVKYQ